MKFITENEVLNIIKKVFPYITDLKSTSVISEKLFNDDISLLISEFCKEFGEECKELKLDSFSNILSVTDDINNLRGADKMTIHKLIDEICLEDPDSAAVTFDNITYSHRELYEMIKRVASGFLKLGIVKNTHVVIILENCIEYIISYFALFYIGAIPIPINTRWTFEEAVKVIVDSNTKFFIAKEHSGRIKFSDIEKSLKKSGIDVEAVIKCDETDCLITFNNLLETEETVFNEVIAPDDVAMISYTSGTTGKPKGVMLKNCDIVKISVYTKEIWVASKEKTFSIAPLYSAQGFLSLLINFAIGSRFKMISSFNTNDILIEISKKSEELFHTQPTMWTMLLNSRAINFADFSGLRKIVVSGSLCSPELAKRIETRLNCRLLNAYGLIEGTSVVTMTRFDDSDDVRFNTVGRPIPGVEIKIVDENRCTLSNGEIGELAIRGYNMLGYYKNPEKTNEVIDSEGWLYTGDLAQYYDDENIRIVGRCKDMIIRGGFNVYPSDIEEVILQMPEVQSAAVVGKLHDVLGEEIIAFVVLRAGVMLKKTDITRYVFSKLANYKLPDHVFIINDMPAILAGKIDKKILRDWAENGIPKDKEIRCFNESEK